MRWIWYPLGARMLRVSRIHRVKRSGSSAWLDLWGLRCGRDQGDGHLAGAAGNRSLRSAGFSSRSSPR
jgi:hypothetical protein